MDFDYLVQLMENKKNDALSKTKWRQIDLNVPIILTPHSAYIDKISKTLLNNGFCVKSIWDKNSLLHGHEVNSIKVTPMDFDLNLHSENNIVIISTNPTSVEQLYSQMMGMQIPPEQIYLLEDLIQTSAGFQQMLFLLNYMDNPNNWNNDRFQIKEAMSYIAQLFENLQDDKSKDALISILSARYFGDLRIITHIIEGNQYFPDFFPIRNNEIFIDAGAFTGDTAIAFRDRAFNKNFTIHCFEPSPAIYSKLCNNIAGDERFVVYDYALGSEIGEINFSSANDGTSKVNGAGDLMVRVTSGDSLKLQPTWIKADIEGSEMELLRGLQETIRKYKPRLSICVYHNSFDIWEIAAYIKSLVPEYHFFLRHHTKSFAETVLHAGIIGDYE